MCPNLSIFHFQHYRKRGKTYCFLTLLFFFFLGFCQSHEQTVSQEGQQDVTQHLIEAVQQVRTLAAQQRMEEAIALAESQRDLMLAVCPEAYHRILIPLYAVTGQYESCFENMLAVREIQQGENPRQRYRYLLLEDAALTAMVESDTASCNRLIQWFLKEYSTDPAKMDTLYTGLHQFGPRYLAGGGERAALWLYDNMLQDCALAIGENTEMYMTVCMMAASTFSDAAYPDYAIQYLEKALASARQLWSNPHDYIGLYRSLFSACLAAGEYAKAAQYIDDYMEYTEIREDLARLSYFRCLLDIYLGEFSKAYTNLQQNQENYIAILSLLMGEDMIRANLANAMAVAALNLGYYEESERHALSMIALPLDKNPEYKALAYTYLAFCRLTRHDFPQVAANLEKAEKYFAASSNERIQRSYHAGFLRVRAACWAAQGDYAKAVEILRKANGWVSENAPELILAQWRNLIDMAYYYGAAGNDESRIDCLLQAEDLVSAAWGTENPDYVELINQRVGFYSDLNLFDGIGLEVLWGSGIMDSISNLETINHYSAYYFLTLSDASLVAQDYHKAVNHALMASVLYQELYPEQVTVDVIHAWYNIAYAAMESGALEEADSLYALCEAELQSGPDAVHSQTRHSATGMQALPADWMRMKAQVLSGRGLCRLKQQDYAVADNFFTQAMEAWEDGQGQDENYYRTLSLQLISCYMQGDFAKAVPLFRQYDRFLRHDLGAKSLLLTESDMAAYIANAQEIYKLAFYYGQPCVAADSSFSRDLYDAALFSKAILLWTSSQWRNRALSALDSETQSLWAEWQRLQKEDGQDAMAELEKSMDILRLENRLHQQLGQEGIYERLASVSSEGIKRSLPGNTLAVEFVYAQGFEADARNLTASEGSYWALLLRRGWSRPVLVYLCQEKELEQMMNQGYRVYSGYLAGKVYDKIVRPMLPYLQESDTIYFASAGILNRLNLDVLFSTQEETAGKYVLRQLLSTREILQREEKHARSLALAVLYGGLVYEDSIVKAGTELLVSRSSETEKPSFSQIAKESPASAQPATSSNFQGYDSLSRQGWRYLPESKEEAEFIAGELASAGIPVKLYAGAAGTEASFKALSGSPVSLLHMATHGFFVPDGEARDETYFEQFRLGLFPDRSIDPLQRSGLILSGGQRAWLLGDADEEDDGILTAREIADMHFDSLSIVVLSACETALGDIAQEGVWGLQWAFKLAGADCMLMSLWEVNDQATSLLMREFYKQLLIGKPKREAFRMAQEKVKAWNPSPYYWAAFLMIE